MSIVIPSINQDELRCPSEEEYAGIKYFAPESNLEFDDEPINLDEAIQTLREDLGSTFRNARVYNRYSEEYYEASKMMIDGLINLARGAVSLAKYHPREFFVRGWHLHHLIRENYIREASFHFRKVHAAVEDSDEYNDKIHMRMLGLESQWLMLIQRLEATEIWLKKETADYTEWYQRKLKRERDERIVREGAQAEKASQSESEIAYSHCTGAENCAPAEEAACFEPASQASAADKEVHEETDPMPRAFRAARPLMPLPSMRPASAIKEEESAQGQTDATEPPKPLPERSIQRRPIRFKKKSLQIGLSGKTERLARPNFPPGRKKRARSQATDPWLWPMPEPLEAYEPLEEYAPLDYEPL